MPNDPSSATASRYVVYTHCAPLIRATTDVRGNQTLPIPLPSSTGYVDPHELTRVFRRREITGESSQIRRRHFQFALPDDGESPSESASHWTRASGNSRSRWTSTGRLSSEAAAKASFKARTSRSNSRSASCAASCWRRFSTAALPIFAATSSRSSPRAAATCCALSNLRRAASIRRASGVVKLRTTARGPCLGAGRLFGFFAAKRRFFRGFIFAPHVRSSA